MFVAHCWPNFVATLVFSNLFFCPDETASDKKFLLEGVKFALSEAGRITVLKTGVCISVKVLLISPALLQMYRL